MEKKKDFGPSETVLLAQKGDEEAIAVLFTEYRPMLLRAVSASVAGLADVGYSREDLMQEAGVAFSSAIATYDGGRGVTFGAYARRCVRNRLISVSRTANKVRKARAVQAESTRMSADVPAIDVEALRSRLTPLEGEVLSHLLGGYKPGEIALRLGRPVKSVYNAVCRIKAKAKSI